MQNRAWGWGGLFVVVALVGCGPGSSIEESGKSALIRQFPGNCGDGALTVVNASASAEENNHFHASLAVDGNEGTRWSSGRATTAWLVLDLGKTGMIRSLSIDWERAFSPSFWIQASDNAVNWATRRDHGRHAARRTGRPDLDDGALPAHPLAEAVVVRHRLDQRGHRRRRSERRVARRPLQLRRADPAPGGARPGIVTAVQLHALGRRRRRLACALKSSNFTADEWLALDLGERRPHRQRPHHLGARLRPSATALQRRDLVQQTLDEPPSRSTTARSARRSNCSA